MKNFFLTLSGVIDLLIATLHLVRFLSRWPVTAGSVVIPTGASLWAALVFFLLAMGCFVARRGNP